MRLRRLRIEHLRAFESLELELEPGWNVFVGPNGAGKTTVLEAAYVLSHARSFRSGAKDSLIQRGAERFSVYGVIERADGVRIGLGIARAAGELDARANGELVPVTELVRQVAVSCFEPGSHELISGPAELRRRYLDWGVFHVEPNFLSTWRAYRRALDQRNALLRAGTTADALDPWDRELARNGRALTEMRAAYMARLTPLLADTLRALLGELGAPRMSLESGWRGEGDPLAILAASRDTDLQRGHTTRGPHRADWSIGFENAPRREHLSRGQEKLCALACVMAQAGVFAAVRGEWPILCVDDLASELDEPHQEAIVRTLRATDAQVLVTGTQPPRILDGMAAATFHVEPGRVVPLI